MSAAVRVERSCGSKSSRSRSRSQSAREGYSRLGRRPLLNVKIEHLRWSQSSPRQRTLRQTPARPLLPSGDITGTQVIVGIYRRHRVSDIDRCLKVREPVAVDQSAVAIVLPWARGLWRVEEGPKLLTIVARRVVVIG